MGYKLKRILIYPDGVTEKQVYPTGWKPGANTLLYLPLENNAVDQSGNSRTTSDSGVTYTTLNGVQCAYIGQNGGINITNDFLSTSLTGKTISAWVNVSSLTTGTDRYIFYTLINGNNSFCSLVIPANDSNLSSFVGNGTSVSSSSNAFQANQWFNVVTTGSSTESAIYVNGQKIISGAGSAYPRGYYNVSYNNGTRAGATHDGREFLNGYMREFILESKARTAQEVANYYNSTKSTYGL